MKTQLYKLLLILFLSISAHAQIWKIDPKHSSIIFNAKHSDISFVNGRFMGFEAKVEGGIPVDFSAARVSFKAQVSSISTGAEGRDKHLKNVAFFDMENHLTISSLSKIFIKSSENTYKVVGDLTVRGNTKEVILSASHIGSTKTRDNLIKIEFQIIGRVFRNDFDVSGTSSSVAPDIEIKCNIEMSEHE